MAFFIRCELFFDFKTFKNICIRFTIIFITFSNFIRKENKVVVNNVLNLWYYIYTNCKNQVKLFIEKV